MSTIKTYAVTMHIQCESHPRKWLMETIAMALEPGEDITDYEITEVAEVAEVNAKESE